MLWRARLQPAKRALAGLLLLLLPPCAGDCPSLRAAPGAMPPGALCLDHAGEGPEAGSFMARGRRKQTHAQAVVLLPAK